MPNWTGLPDNRPEQSKKLNKGDVDFSMDTSTPAKLNWKGADDYARPTTDAPKVPSIIEGAGTKGSKMSKGSDL